MLQLNCNGVQHMRTELDSYLHSNKIMVACLQETKLSDSSPPLDFPGYSLVRRDRPVGGGGGLLTLVREDIHYKRFNTEHLFPNDNVIEHSAIVADFAGTPLIICNIYIPPPSSCPVGYVADLGNLLSIPDDILIVGDFNAHHPGWYSSTLDHAAAARGTALAEAINDSALMVLNEDSPTRRPTNGPLTSPDLTLTNPHIALNSTWRVDVDLASDHLPILITLGGPFNLHPKQSRRTYKNIRKTDWKKYLEHTERSFSWAAMPTNVDTGELIFRQILLQAGEKYTPKGNVPEYVPDLTDEAKELIKARNDLRSRDPADPRVRNLNNEVAATVAASKRTAWANAMMECSHKRQNFKFWKYVSALSGKKTSVKSNQPITFNNRSSSQINP